MHPAIELIRRLVRRSGFDVTRHPPAQRRAEADYLARMREGGVTVLVDGGANEGQFALAMRDAGWDGPIISFEPLPDAFAILETRAATDPGWRTLNVALGSRAASGTIHVAGNSVSSSLLPMLDAHLHAAPDSAYIDAAEIVIVTLDDALAGMVSVADRICLKLDCQGYEREILDGAPVTLSRTVVAVIELSMVSLYEGGMVFDEAVSRLRAESFALTAIEPVFADPDTGELLAVDGCFVRRQRPDGPRAARQ